MIFLIEYDRAERNVVSRQSFEDSDFATAEDARLALELTLNRSGIAHEVVLLQAANEEALRRTHLRYFETIKELIRLTG